MRLLLVSFFNLTYELHVCLRQWASLGVMFCVYSAMQSLSINTEASLRAEVGGVGGAAFSLNANTCIREVPGERADPARPGRIWLCGGFQAPLCSDYYHLKAQFCRAGLCEDAACQAEF